MSETETEDRDSIKLHAFIFWTDLKVNILKIVTAVHSSYPTLINSSYSPCQLRENSFAIYSVTETWERTGNIRTLDSKMWFVRSCLTSGSSRLIDQIWGGSNSPNYTVRESNHFCMGSFHSENYFCIVTKDVSHLLLNTMEALRERKEAQSNVSVSGSCDMIGVHKSSKTNLKMLIK